MLDAGADMGTGAAGDDAAVGADLGVQDNMGARMAIISITGIIDKRVLLILISF